LPKDIKMSQSPAERMRSYRRRRRRGFRYVDVQVGPAEVNGLIANGYLPSDKQHDIHAIQLAVNDLLFDWLRQT
jgi:hypothetical protein